MIDFHSHTLFSDGVLVPSELARRAKVAGYEVLGITDHVDRSNIDFVIPRIKAVCEDLSRKAGLLVIPGVELTHIPPEDFAELTLLARGMGIELVIAHGETLAEPVKPGTNHAAIEAGVTILAHPGLITLDEARRAASKNVFLEISSRKGHCLANGHVALLARQAQAKLVIDTDTHEPADLISREYAGSVLAGAGLELSEMRQVLEVNAWELARKFGYGQ